MSNAGRRSDFVPVPRFVGSSRSFFGTMLFLVRSLIAVLADTTLPAAVAASVLCIGNATFAVTRRQLDGLCRFAGASWHLAVGHA